MRLSLMVVLLALLLPSVAAGAKDSKVVKFKYAKDTTMFVFKGGTGQVRDHTGDILRIESFRISKKALTKLKQAVADADLENAKSRYRFEGDYPIVCAPAAKVITAGGRTVKIDSGATGVPAGLKRLAKRLTQLLDRVYPVQDAKAAQCSPGGPRD